MITNRHRHAITGEPADMSDHANMAPQTILIAFGANLPTEQYGAPGATLKAALRRLAADGDISVRAVSPFYETAPVPVSDQPWYVNGVAEITTALPAAALLERLHEIEAEFGRVRRLRNEARVIDLDLIAYGDMQVAQPGGMQLPHPRMHERAFVLLPLRDIAPGWVHPVSGQTVAELAAALQDGQEIRRARDE